MSHQTIIYGYVESATWRREAFRKYQYKNLEIVAQLPEEGDWPYLTANMFSSGEPVPYRDTFLTHILHFGTSTKERSFEQRDQWVAKFEALIAKMYWHSVIVHYETETYGQYQYKWNANIEWRSASGKFQTNYDIEELPPTNSWKRQLTSHGEVIEPFET